MSHLVHIDLTEEQTIEIGRLKLSLKTLVETNEIVADHSDEVASTVERLTETVEEVFAYLV